MGTFLSMEARAATRVSRKEERRPRPMKIVPASRAIGPTTGQLAISSLAMKQVGKRARRTMMSSQEVWLATMRKAVVAGRSPETRISTSRRERKSSNQADRISFGREGSGAFSREKIRRMCQREARTRRARSGSGATVEGPSRGRALSSDEGAMPSP